MVNVDVTSPGATLALGMMFFRTNNTYVVDSLSSTSIQLFCYSHFKSVLRNIKPTYYPLQHASLFVQLLYVVFVKSSDKL